MGITLNSNKTLNVSPNPNARLAAKANVIVVQKGPARGVTLSHAGKEVLGKVIMGGKNLCLQNQQSASSVALLPHRISTNGDQAVTTMLSTINLSQPETAKSNIKDISERNNKVLSQFVETSTIFSTDPPKTSIINPISHGATKDICNDDSISNKTLHMNCSVTSNFTIEQKEDKQRSVPREY
ncbi:uncharacterized protein LOC107270929 [Cephus cinctus]|uniref:Uncharacterized protein LOC107270929 n=1 Tax=Cephus cinctus TaxID=211228 RepID=A0AAJ7RN49_CEPCN|nr:uncharacterized protein LOC107270929 [Cephus cinctus]